MGLPSSGHVAAPPNVFAHWNVTPDYMRAVTVVWGIAVRALEQANYQPLLPDLLPDVLRGEVRDERSEAQHIATALCGWARRGAALPLRYHMTRSRPPAQDGSPRAVVSAFSVLRGNPDCARQHAADTDAVRDLLESLGIDFAGGRHLGGQEQSCPTTGLFATINQTSVQVATLTDHGEQPLPRRGHDGGLPNWLTALRLDLTGLTGWLRQRIAGLEARG